MNDIRTRIDELYKTESARLLAVLTRIFGPQNLALAEDTLQDAFAKALVHWQVKGVPDNPSAWIVQTAKHQAIDAIRAYKTRVKFSQDLAQLLESEWSLSPTVDHAFAESSIKDDQLRMIFMCCHGGIKPKNLIPFILRTLCGFGIPAIARAFVLPEATIKKRLYRTRSQLKHHKFELPPIDALAQAMDTVHTVLYLLFNEGFHSSEDKRATNAMFCQEAIGLVHLLIEEPRVVNQDTLGLSALMHFHFARLDAKVDREGHAVPLDLQDRQRWNGEHIRTAQRMLDTVLMTPPGASGRFCIEARIAREHCRAERFDDTDWQAIVGHYEELITLTDSPIARLNHAIAMGYAGNVSEAVARLEALQDIKALKHSHMPSATLAHFHAMVGRADLAYEKAEESKRRGGTPREHHLMMQQIERLLREKRGA